MTAPADYSVHWHTDGVLLTYGSTNPAAVAPISPAAVIIFAANTYLARAATGQRSWSSR